MLLLRSVLVAGSSSELITLLQHRLYPSPSRVLLMHKPILPNTWCYSASKKRKR